MVRSIFRSRRFNPAHAEEEQTPVHPFFSKVPPQKSRQQKQTPFFQAKLTINQPNDKYEQEADNVANAVVNHPASAPVVQQKNISNIQRQATTDEDRLGTHDARMLKDKELQKKPDIQRLCPECEKEKEKGVQRMSMPEEEKEEEDMVQPKAEGTSTTATHALSSRIENSTGKGRPLPSKTRSEMQSAFGVDFSGVNIHTDTEAVQMNKDLKAQAFTHGSDIYFNAGKYNPETSGGKQLLAHELTHVVQQGKNIPMSKAGNQATKVQRQDNDEPQPQPNVGPPGEDIEENICTAKFGNGKWEVCCPVPGAAQASEDACFSSESWDETREKFKQKRKISIPQCEPGRIPNIITNTCCPKGQIPIESKCQTVTAPETLCRPEQTAISGICCFPPMVPGLTGGCIFKPNTSPAPAPSNFVIPVKAVIDDYNNNEFTINQRQKKHFEEVKTQIIGLAALCPVNLMIITGHTDAPGKPGDNEKLGKLRADMVKIAFMMETTNIKAASMISISRGENDPVDTEAGEKPSPRNRRVEIDFRAICSSKLK